MIRRRLTSAAGLLLMLQGTASMAAICATPSREGVASITTTNTVVNTYYPGLTAAVSAGSTQAITLGPATGASTPISAGDLLLIVQIQGASISTRNNRDYGADDRTGAGYTALNTAGSYEYARAANSVPLSGGVLNLATPTTRSYANGTASSSTPRRRYQVIRVPQYRDLTLSGSITAPQWNGASGGVVVLDVAGSLQLSGGSINVTGRGFRGGGAIASSTGSGSNSDFVTNHSSNEANGSKGEGIVGTPMRLFDGAFVSELGSHEIMGSGSAARGAPGNAGGGGTDGNPAANDQNTGGGGGGNGGAGGNGGIAWCPSWSTAACPATGGLGGVDVNGSGTNVLVLGGGGGSGTTNNATGPLANGASSSGAPGGGAILVRANTVSGSGSLIANGAPPLAGVTNDGTGGGGAGGTIQFHARQSSATISASAVGSNGASNTGAGASHGPGGGGGGGVIISNVSLATNVSGGLPGTTTTNSVTGPNYGATAGTTGIALSTFQLSQLPGLSSGGECVPSVQKSMSQTTLSPGGSSRVTITLSNPNPTQSISGLAATDPLPAGTAVAPNPQSSTTCAGGTVTASPGTTFLNLANATLAAGASCTYAADIIVSQSGSFTNRIDVGAVSALFTGSAGPSTNALPASVSYSVNQGLQITKTVATLWDPLTLFTNPKAIPGAILQYSLTVTNHSPVAIATDSIMIRDQIPENTSLVVGDFYAVHGFAGTRGPFQFVNGNPSSNLNFTYTALGNTTDSPDFSADGSSFSYTPVTSPLSVDPAIRAFRARLFGTMAPNSSFTVNFLVRLN